MTTSSDRRPVTLSDVARAAGVSLATASRVLNGSTRKVADEYRQRVAETAERLGYTANLSAQATARGTSAVIALLVADIADPYFGMVAAGVVKAAEESGLIVTIGITGRAAAHEAKVVQTLRGQRPRGVILAASRSSRSLSPALARELDLLAQGGGRAVVLGRGNGSARGVTIDNRGGARALGTALADLGYRDAVVLATDEGVVTSDHRMEGFTEGFTSGGGAAPRLYRGGFDRDGGIDMMQRALADGIDPGTVVFGISDVVAMGACLVVREAGREVGSDIAVAGFDDIPSTRDLTPSLSTVRIPLGDVGYQAARAVMDEAWVQDDEALSLDVRLRDSTPPRSS